jgi:predicted phosphodiesterase
MARVSIQIMSDLHLETHPSYDSFQFAQSACYLALLGDIGRVADQQLFSFLETQLQQCSIVFFLLGNHEPYHMSFTLAKSKMRAFEAKMNKLHSRHRNGRFVFLDQTRYDLTDDLTVLGCTLFSLVSPQQEFAVEDRLVDFRDILRWTVDDHNAAHESDRAWLNAQVSRIAEDEPHRRVVIFTHHSPSVDPRCTNPKYHHKGSEVSSGFATDLSGDGCWTNPIVKAWAFGHTHYPCYFTDESGKVVMSNPKGYYLIPQRKFDAGKVLTLGDQ